MFDLFVGPRQWVQLVNVRFFEGRFGGSLRGKPVEASHFWDPLLQDTCIDEGIWSNASCEVAFWPDLWPRRWIAAAAHRCFPGAAPAQRRQHEVYWSTFKPKPRIYVFSLLII